MTFSAEPHNRPRRLWPQRDVIVVGGSAGGVDALTKVVAALPAGLPAAVLVVIHIPAGLPSALASILARVGHLRVAPVAQGPVEHGTIYVAPPDHHLTLDAEGACLSRGPRVHGHRPAIDPLFQSAAHVAGSRVIGVVLSGARDDGAAGMVDIALAGGTTLVQAPTDALHASMPRNVIARVKVDHILPAALLGAELARLAGSRNAAERGR